MNVDSFASVARSFLSAHPDILDLLVLTLHNVADDISACRGTRSITAGKYMQPYHFKQSILEKALSKIGYSVKDIPDICNQGRAAEILQEIDKLEKPHSASSVMTSRRALPPPLTRGMRFEDITDLSRKPS